MNRRMKVMSRQRRVETGLAVVDALLKVREVVRARRRKRKAAKKAKATK